MPHTIAQWAILGGVVAWDLTVGAAIIWLAYRDRPTWTQKVRAPKAIKADRITSDWRPLV